MRPKIHGFVFGIGTGMIQHSPNSMLKSHNSLIQGSQHHQIDSNMDDSLPRIDYSINEGSEKQHRASVSVDQTPDIATQHQHVAAYCHNFTQSQPQCQHNHSFAQEFSKRHSMELITPLSTSFGHTYTNNGQQTNLFLSSSHHTAHTAAAGDLLSMSRRALDNPHPSNPSNDTKKRSSTMVDGMCDVGSACDRSSITPGRYKTSSIVAQHAPLTLQFNSQNIQKGLFIPSLQDASCFNKFQLQSPTLTTTSTCVSSPLVGAVDGNNQSYQHHRTIRQCIRSDSFEMMDDN